MKLKFEPINFLTDCDEVNDFLSKHTWPFHASSTLSKEEASNVISDSADTSIAFQIMYESQLVGLLRVMDLDDIKDGSPMFDLRIAPKFRSKGIGRSSVSWMVKMMFDKFSGLVRIETTSRVVNQAMRSILESNKFQLEGLLRKTWVTDINTDRLDTAIYGLLRSDLSK